MRPMFSRLFTVLVGVLPIAVMGAETTALSADSAAVTQDTADDSGATVPMCYFIAIERITIDDMKLHDTLDVTLTSSGSQLGGFDFKFGLSGSIADILEVLPGELLDSCDWEYFNALPVRVDTTSSRYPDALWQAVGLARFVPSEQEPECFGFDHSVSLIRLVVSSGEMSRIPDTAVPIFFFWEDCTDNTISGVKGDTVSFSSAVIDYFPVDLPDSGDVFPTRCGALRQCIKPRLADRNLRQTEFHNGGVEFRLELGLESDDTSGVEGE